MRDVIEGRVKKAFQEATCFDGSLICECDHGGPGRSSRRCATYDFPSTPSRASTNAAIDVIACLRISIERDIGHFAIAVGKGICYARPLLPRGHLPYLADATATGPIFYSTVVPHLL